jgi:hypothetical protein
MIYSLFFILVFFVIGYLSYKDYKTKENSNKIATRYYSGFYSKCRSCNVNIKYTVFVNQKVSDKSPVDRHAFAKQQKYDLCIDCQRYLLNPNNLPRPNIFHENNKTCLDYSTGGITIPKNTTTLYYLCNTMHSSRCKLCRNDFEHALPITSMSRRYSNQDLINAKSEIAPLICFKCQSHITVP